MRRFGVVLVGLLMVVACGSKNAGHNVAQPLPSSTPPTTTPLTPAPSPSRLVISPAALCVELVPHLQTATNIINAIGPNINATDAYKKQVGDAYDDLVHDYDVAPSDYQTFIQVMINTMQQLKDALTTGGQLNLQLQDFQSAGLELGTRCSAFASG